MLFDRPHRRAEAPRVGHYVAEGARGFVFDRSSRQPLLRFEGSEEVWALTPQHAPKGDVIYKNDVGEPVLRASRLGGLTVFTDGRPEGAAAALRGGAPSLQLPPLLTAIAIGNRLQQASTRASRAAGRLIVFDAPDLGPESAVVAVDAALVTAEAFERLSKDKGRSQLLRKMKEVFLLEGSGPSVKVEGSALTITVVPGQGVAGRPSSARIRRALRD